MTDQPAGETESPLFQSPSLFQQPAATVGRPPSSRSMDAPAPSSPPDPSPSPAASSTSPAPSSSTEPRGIVDESGPAQLSAGSSPSDEPSGKSLKDRIEAGLRSVTSTAHHTLTDDVGRAHQLFLATEPELEATADGAASLITRRLGPAVGSSELGDIIQIGMALASYATRTVTKWRQTRAQRAQMAEATAQQQVAGG